MASENSAPASDHSASDHGPSHGGAHTETVGHGETHGGGGLPQLQMEHWGGQIIWLLLVFITLYVLLSKVFLPRLRAVQDERAATIDTAVSTARQVQAEAEAQAAQARANAEEAVVNARIAEAEAAIMKGRDAAMAHVSTIAADTARAMVERLTGATASADEAKAAVKGAA